MKAEYHEETFSFRYTQLAQPDVDRLRVTFPLVEVRQRKDDELRFVAAINLAEGRDLDALYRFLDLVSPDPGSYGPNFIPD